MSFTNASQSYAMKCLENHLSDEKCSGEKNSEVWLTGLGSCKRNWGETDIVCDWQTEASTMFQKL